MMIAAWALVIPSSAAMPGWVSLEEPTNSHWVDLNLSRYNNIFVPNGRLELAMKGVVESNYSTLPIDAL